MGEGAGLSGAGGGRAPPPLPSGSSSVWSNCMADSAGASTPRHVCLQNNNKYYIHMIIYTLVAAGMECIEITYLSIEPQDVGGCVLSQVVEPVV